MGSNLTVCQVRCILFALLVPLFPTNHSRRVDMRGIAAATILGYLPKGEEEPLCEACIEALKSFIDECEVVITRVVVFVCDHDLVRVAEEVVASLGVGCSVEVCPTHMAAMSLEHAAREYGRAHNLEVICIH